MDKEKKYSTGQIEKIFGLSRDTLRYYEKKAIIEPGQKDNHYREYNIVLDTGYCFQPDVSPNLSRKKINEFLKATV